MHRFFQDLMEAGASPAKLRAIWPAKSRLADIAKLYREYLALLEGRGLFDRPAVYALATKACRENPSPPCQVIVVDGFSRLSPAQMSLVAALGGRGEIVHMAAPQGTDSSQPVLVRAEAALLGAIRDAFDLVETTNLAGPGGKLAPETEVLEAPDPDAEVELIGMRAKRLLLENRARPGQVGVILRDLESRAVSVRRIFRKLGIPFQVAACRRALASGFVRSVVSLVRAAAEDLPRGRVVDVLRSPYFSLLPLGVKQANRAKLAEHFETVAVQAGMTHCAGDFRAAFARIGRRLKRLSRELESEEVHSGVSPGIMLARLKRVNNPACAVLEKLTDFARRDATFVQWIGRLETLLEDLGATPLTGRAQPDETACFDLAAWKSLAAVVSEVAEAESITPDEPMRPAAFARRLRSLAAHALVDEPEPKHDVVRVLTPDQALPLRFKAVFVGSLVEGTFPRHSVEHTFLGSEEFARLRAGGVYMQRRHDADDEKALFCQSVNRADERLYLSFNYMDDQARPTVVSSFLRETANRRIDTGGEPLRMRLPAAPTIPHPELITAPHHLRRYALWRLVRKPLNAELRHMLAVADEAPPGAVRHAADSIIIENKRWRQGPLDSYDGVLDSPNAIALVCDRFPTRWQTNAHEIDSYVSCPFAFFAERVLGLEPPEEELAGLDPRERGLVLHAALASFFRDMPESERRRPQSNRQRLHAAADGILARLEDARAGTYTILFEAESSFLHAALDTYLDRLADRQGDWTPARFEVAFGRSRHAADHDPRPLELSNGELTVEVSGRIDRIDELVKDNTIFLRILDYKTRAKSFTKTAALEGRQLQMPLYMIAAAEILYGGKRAALVKGEYVGLTDRGYLPIKARENPSADAPLAEMWQTIDETARMKPVAYLEAIRKGRFPVNMNEQCRYCAFRLVCRAGEARLARKTQDNDEE